MRKIFSILVVLMMVAGTFVSCNMPTNDTPTVSTVNISATDIPNCDLSYLTLANGKKAICTDEVRILIDAASDKQSVLDAQRKINIRNSEPAGWADDVYDVSGGWVKDAEWSGDQKTLTIYGWKKSKDIDTKADLGFPFSIYLSSNESC